MHRIFFILAFIAFTICTLNAQTATDKTTTNPTWKEKVVPILIGGALTLVGGLISQALFLWLNRRHERATLLVALRSELKLMRENIGTDVQGFRDSLRFKQTPRPEVFILTTPIFDANAGRLGQLKDLVQIESLVYVFDSLKRLGERARFFEKISNGRLELRDLNEIHLYATFLHLDVMKLHNRLKGVTLSEDLSETEKETRKFVEEFQVSGKLDEILSRVWTDA
jgi:hypothetical protein